MPYSSDTHTLTHLVLHRRAVYAVSVSVPGERVIAAEAELLSTGPTVCLIGISGRRSVEPARSSGGCLDKITRLFHIASIHSQVDRLLVFFSKDQPRSIPCSAFAIESEWPRKRRFFFFFTFFYFYPPPHADFLFL